MPITWKTSHWLLVVALVASNLVVLVAAPARAQGPMIGGAGNPVAPPPGIKTVPAALEGGFAASVPWLTAALFSMLGGLICDWICKRSGPCWGCRRPTRR